MSSVKFLVLSAAFVGAICSASQSIPAQAEPMQAAADASGEAARSWKTSTPGLVAHASKADRSAVASATRKLDLSKLTMADFGDVDQSR